MLKIRHPGNGVARLPRKLLLLALVALLLNWPTSNRVEAAASDLDPTFGSGGKVTTDFFGNIDVVNALVIQPDGKIIAAGIADNPPASRDFALARYKADGSLDTSFGNGGKVTTDFFGSFDQAQAVAIQLDGKIVVAGSADQTSTGDDFALARYNSDGSLDSTFGSGGKVTIHLSISDGFRAVALQTDGKIVAAGFTATSSGGFALMRFNSNGSLDATFGSGGKVFTNFSGGPGSATSLGIQANGQIVVAGMAWINFDIDFGLARYNTDGSLDPTFGSGGKVTTGFFNVGGVAKALAIQKDGKIIAAGLAENSDISLGSDIALARYHPDGSLDSTFGSGGKITTSFTMDDNAHALALQPDGKIVAGGRIYNDLTGSDFALVRYKGDGMALDMCLQDDSNGNLLQIDTTTGAYQFTNCGGLTLGGTGTLTKRGNQITLLHNASDRRVMASINTSTNKATASIHLLSQGRTFSITDRNITNNTCACR